MAILRKFTRRFLNEDMNNLRILFILTSILLSFNIGAVTVSKEEALQKALTFLQCPDKQASISLFTITGEAEMYKVITKNGWVLLSTEKNVKPILAYSHEPTFPDSEDMPDGLKWLFSHYEDAIAYAKQHPQEYNNVDTWNNTRSELSNTRDTICLTRLGEIQWGQCRNNSYSIYCENIYNKYCPTFHYPCCDRTYTGCGAVALGQVLWYYQWPHAGLIPNQMLNDNGQVSSESSYRFYNWSIMPNVIYSTTPTYMVNEVAALLRDCGYATYMQYGTDESNTTVDNIESALRNRFGYSQAYSLFRGTYVGNWVNLMKNEIRNGRPVIYRGEHPAKGNTGVGHFFVLFGFEDNYFMINWGWRGAWNTTYCTLDSLCVNSTHYNNGHYAIVNIQPTYPFCTPITILPHNEWNTNFLIQRGGGITIGNRIVTDNMRGGILSGDYVRLTNGFRINQGASVLIGIRDMNCDDREVLLAPANSETTTDVPFEQDGKKFIDVNKFFRNGQLFIQRGDKTYTVTGQEIK